MHIICPEKRSTGAKMRGLNVEESRSISSHRLHQSDRHLLEFSIEQSASPASAQHGTN